MTENIRFNHKKAVQALNFFAEKEGGVINNMKALKLLWVSDRHHLRQYGRTILGDKYVAMEFGPVASSTRNILTYNDVFSDKRHIAYAENVICGDGKGLAYRSISKFEPKFFSTSDLNVLSEVYSTFGDIDGFILSDFAHNYPEWKRFENCFGLNQRKAYPIEYLDFFKNPELNNHPIFSESEEELALVRDIFENP